MTHVLNLWGSRVVDWLGGGRDVVLLSSGSSGVRHLGAGVGSLRSSVTFTDDLGEESKVGVADVRVAEVEAGYCVRWRVVLLDGVATVGGGSGSSLIGYSSWGRILDLKTKNK